MTASTDMSTPVTRGELQEELQRFRQELRQELRQEFRQELKGELEHVATKAELAELAAKTTAEIEHWGGALLSHIDRTSQRLSSELAQHAGALHEWMLALLRASDERYADLPGRVSRLEAAVFVPKPP